MNLFGSEGQPAYHVQQVLITPTQAALRSVIAAFLCPTGFAPLWDAPYRKAGGPTCVGLSTSPASALISAAKVSTRSNPL
jgi:hypothetical protein